jgi:drug/metabolite transporter (DMT)-like permease
MVNYLWPSLTIVFAIVFNGQKTNLWVIPGLLISLLGVAWVLGGEQGLHLDEIVSNVVSNPLSYGLAFAGAFIWAAYCTVTSKYAKGNNGITLFVLLTALALWLKYAFSDHTAPMTFTLVPLLEVLFVGLSTAIAYSAWNHGIQQGNLTLLATASYFTPVLSALMGSLWLGLTPPLAFWQGVAMITLGSLICWRATRSL